MNKAKLLAILAVMVLLLTLPSVASAQRLPPHVFVGTAWIDDVAAPAGTTVSAWVGGAEAGSTTTTGAGGDYVLVVDQGDASFAGETISFLIGGFSATQTAVWMQGGGDELTLSASSGPVPGVAATITTAFAGPSQHLVDSRGLTLYLFTDDTQGSDSSTCTGACVDFRPLVLTGADPVASGNADESLLGSFERADDLGTQVTYNGWPLYYFVQDVAPGDTLGQGVGDTWWIVSISGEGIINIFPPAATGVPGETGQRGPTGRTGSTGSEGLEGPAGAQGSRGLAGLTGSAGVAGAAGAQGDTGPAGAQGATGAAGARGAAGEEGNSAALGIVALILAIVAIVGAGGAFLLSRRSS